MKIVKYGTVEITWGTDDRPCIDVRGFSVDCEGEIPYPISSGEFIVKLLKDTIVKYEENLDHVLQFPGVSVHDKDGNRIR